MAICGIINGYDWNGFEFDEMKNLLLSSKKLIPLHNYSDEAIKISQISLKNIDYPCYENDDILIYSDGEIYNLDEINYMFKFDAKNLSDLILISYNHNVLDKVLNKIDGYFIICLYDKIKRKFLIISDRLGLKYMYYYLKDGKFVFASEVKSIIVNPCIDKTFDKEAFYDFLNSKQGFVYEDETFFEHIKLIKPASILEYDIKNNTLNQRYYWKFSEIKQIKISYNDAVDKLYYLFKDAVQRRIKNINSKEIFMPLSGGLDSRLLLAELYKRGIIPDKVWTMGSKDCLDTKIAKEICEKFKLKHYLSEINTHNWFNARILGIWLSDGMQNIQDMHGIEFYDDDDKVYYGMNGFAGDVILGGNFKTKKSYLNKRITKELAKDFYGNFIEGKNFNDDFYNIDHIEAHLYISRIRRFTTMGSNLALHTSIQIKPFTDNKLVEFVLSIPDEYRVNHNLYADMALKYYPEFFKDIPWQTTSMTISGKINKNKTFIKSISSLKLFPKFIRNWIAKILNPYSKYYVKKDFCQYETWINDSEMKDKIIDLLNSQNSLVYKFLGIDLWNQYAKKFYDKTKKSVREVSKPLTIELYLRELKKRGILSCEDYSTESIIPPPTT